MNSIAIIQFPFLHGQIGLGKGVHKMVMLWQNFNILKELGPMTRYPWWVDGTQIFVITFDRIYLSLEDTIEYGLLRYSRHLKY